MVDQKAEPLEPLLLPTLRVLIAMPLIVLLVPLLLDLLLPEPWLRLVAPPGSAYPAGLPFLVAETAALLFLLLPGLPARLGRWFLPITLLLCTLGPVGTLLWRVLEVSADPAAGDVLLPLPLFGMQGIWPLTFFLTIPLIVIAWQYSLRWVIVYALSLAALNVAMALYLEWTVGPQAGQALLQLAVGNTGVFLATGYLVSRLVASQRQQRAALARANAQLVQYALTQEQLAVSRERNRLARDLHDTLAHALSGLVLELEGARLVWATDPGQAQATLAAAIGTARTGLVETRRALQALRASPLADLGLGGAVRELAERMAARNQWTLDLTLPATPLVLAPHLDEGVYRIVQEGLTNVERHAAATHVTLALTIHGDNLHLRLADDGGGFDTRATDAGQHYGLLGMQERSRLLRGALAVYSSLGQGTVLDLTVPLQSGPLQPGPGQPGSGQPASGQPVLEAAGHGVEPHP